MSGFEKTYAKEPKSTTFSRKFFVSECREISLWHTSVYQNSSAIEKFHALEGDITFLRWIFLTYTALKISVGNPCLFQNLWDIEDLYAQ